MSAKIRTYFKESEYLKIPLCTFACTSTSQIRFVFVLILADFERKALMLMKKFVLELI